MKDLSVAILSGIGTRVIDRFAKQLRANGVELAFVDMKGVPSPAYFASLLDQSIDILRRVTERGADHVSIVLVSGLSNFDHLTMEAAAFFPAARRLAINPEWRNNPEAAVRIRDVVLRHVQDREEKGFVRNVARNARFLLPLRNTCCKPLTESYRAIYSMGTKQLPHRVEKEVVALRKKKGFRIEGIDYELRVNNGRHPIRRQSVTSKCDFDAAFRFGAPVEERLEFDVTCDNGLRGKHFCQCDGSTIRLTSEPSHLNMRINDDFGVA
jgi:hypothetical protein